MLELLSAYLEVNVTPEQKTSYLDACQALIDNGITEHVFLLEQNLAVSDSLDVDTAVSGFEEILLPFFTDIIGEFGIVLSESVTLSEAADVFRSLLVLENYEDKATVNALTSSDDGCEAALSDILELVGRYASVDYIRMFESVSDELLDRIAELTSSIAVEDNPSEETVDVCKHRLRLFLDLPEVDKNKTPLIVGLLMNGARLGVDRHDLIAPHREYLETLSSPKSIASECIGLLLASKEENKDLQKAFGMELDLLHLEQLQRTAVHVAGSQFITKVTYA